MCENILHNAPDSLTPKIKTASPFQHQATTIQRARTYAGPSRDMTSAARTASLGTPQSLATARSPQRTPASFMTGWKVIGAVFPSKSSFSSHSKKLVYLLIIIAANHVVATILLFSTQHCQPGEVSHKRPHRDIIGQQHR